MTASGARTSLPTVRPPLTYAVMGLAAVALLLTGFAIGSSRVTSQQAAQPGLVAPSAAAVVPAAPVAPAVPVTASRLVSESFIVLTHPGPRSTVATGPALQRSAALHPCTAGSVIGDTIGIVAHGPDCSIQTGIRPADEGVDVLTHGRQPSDAGAAGATTATRQSPRPPVHQ